MRYLALACDYDGTLALHGRVDALTIAALEQLRASGRSIVLVTGRRLDDLMEVFPHIELCERVVAENGALLYHPASREVRALAEPPPAAFVAELEKRGVTPLDVGRVIVATWEPHDSTVLAAIRDLGFELHVIFNKGAVMVLPSGINKATGLRTALADLCLSPHNCVGIGDAENDHAFLSLCECAVAVSNALPSLKERSDWVTRRDHGAGVVELIERMLDDDLRSLAPHLRRHDILLGQGGPDDRILLPPAGVRLLLAGASASGKSTLAGGLLERLAAQDYQFVILDPEGDYEDFEAAIVLGDAKHPPLADEIMHVVAKPGQTVVANLLGIQLADRPAFFESLLRRLQELHSRTGRPHWIVIDEAHHLMPASWDRGAISLHDFEGLLLITVHPDHMASLALASIDTVIAVGKSPKAIIDAVPRARAALTTELPDALEPGEAVVWSDHLGERAVHFHVVPPQADRRRHQRKYAEGELGEDKSFYFRGPAGRLSLRAQNLVMFIQLAEGIDDDTWLYHLGRGHYSQWFREAIRDEGLAEEAAGIEAQTEVDAAQTRAQIRAAIEKRYTAPS
jgi:hydroxymethylpyrimidine pyrophosphatase-like HAD family hydrolase